MAEVHWFPSVAQVPERWWDDDAAVPIDRRRRFRRFRDVVEGEHTFVLSVGSPGDPVITCGHVSSPASGLFSDPWKLWSSDQFLRLDGVAPDEAAAITAHRDALLARLTGGDAGVVAGGAGVLHERLGGALVVRGLDSSEVLHAGGAPASSTEAATTLRELQRRASDSDLGVAFPYVDRADAGLLAALSETGFGLGSVTATNIFDLPPRDSFDDLLGPLPGRVRYRFRKEWKDFHAQGLTLEELGMEEHVHDVVALETGNRVKHGGTADQQRLIGVRLAMARLLGGNLRVKGVRDDRGELIACSIDLVDADRHLGMVFGQHETRSSELVYPTLVYAWPLRQAVAAGATQVRMGFEAFAPKTLRGSRLERRVFAFWHPRPAVRAAAGELLSLLDERLSRGVLDGARTTESAGRHWSFAGAKA
ncbi:hypothetical protein KIH74_05100 [Kineosporia sp. J2-2]|uniref:BioF2-like acetyltransferase domain-containing protein n=1 Tax=Kineosporia corallincola TaxID=2835133 RepID=A0ABS5TB33_9ACTN|nr:hypothetical protein [Kineosporia corallincola]MBT0768288.1 hypothetical protein [Kineosporia corallincola]